MSDDKVTSESDTMSPEEIARFLSDLDQFEPVEMTDAELAAWQAERDARKEHEKAEFLERLEKLSSQWD